MSFVYLVIRALILAGVILFVPPSPAVSDVERAAIDAQVGVPVAVVMDPLVVTARDGVDLVAVPIAVPAVTPTVTAIVLTVCFTDGPDDADIVASMAPKSAAQWCVYPVGRCSARSTAERADMAVYLDPISTSSTIYPSTSRESCR